MSALKLSFQFLFSVPFLVLILGALLFLPANSVSWVEGWVFIVLMIGYVGLTYLYFIIKDPSTLQNRSKLSTSGKDSFFLALFGIDFFLLLILPGFDYQYQWSQLPDPAKLIGFLGVCFSFIIIFFVMRENSFASKGVKIHEEQEVITTGPYAIVRHPMYVGFTIMSFFIPIALGSFISLLPAIFCPFFLAMRIRSEEELLKSQLAGYREYMEKVPYRLIPKIW